MKKIIYIFFVFACFSLASCSAAKESARATYTRNAATGADKSSNEDHDLKPVQRMIVYNARVVLSVVNTDSAASALVRLAQKYEGFAVSASNNYVEIRVKSDRLQAALADVAALGKIKEKNVSANDVTGQYTDNLVRLDNAQKARQRYLELLAKAENVEAALKVEKELERLNGEIDLLQSHIKNTEHLVAYSTLEIHLEEKVKLGLLGYVFVGTYQAISWLFVRN